MADTTNEAPERIWVAGTPQECGAYFTSHTWQNLRDAILSLIPKQTEPTGPYVCPECGRDKAKTAQDAAAGKCPKWWAIMDAAPFKDAAP